MTELRWESRGMRDYCLDATGRVVGHTFYLFSKGCYDAEVLAPQGGEVRAGTYVSLEDARRAVERAVAQVEAAAQQTKESTHEQS